MGTRGRTVLWPDDWQQLQNVATKGSFQEDQQIPGFQPPPPPIRQKWQPQPLSRQPVSAPPPPVSPPLLPTALHGPALTIWGPFFVLLGFGSMFVFIFFALLARCLLISKDKRAVHPRQKSDELPSEAAMALVADKAWLHALLPSGRVGQTYAEHARILMAHAAKWVDMLATVAVDGLKQTMSIHAINPQILEMAHDICAQELEEAELADDLSALRFLHRLLTATEFKLPASLVVAAACVDAQSAASREGFGDADAAAILTAMLRLRQPLPEGVIRALPVSSRVDGPPLAADNKPEAFQSHARRRLAGLLDMELNYSRALSAARRLFAPCAEAMGIPGHPLDEIYALKSCRTLVAMYVRAGEDRLRTEQLLLGAMLNCAKQTLPSHAARVEAMAASKEIFQEIVLYLARQRKIIIFEGTLPSVEPTASGTTSGAPQEVDIGDFMHVPYFAEAEAECLPALRRYYSSGQEDEYGLGHSHRSVMLSERELSVLSLRGTESSRSMSSDDEEEPHKAVEVLFEKKSGFGLVGRVLEVAGGSELTAERGIDDDISELNSDVASEDSEGEVDGADVLEDPEGFDGNLDGMDRDGIEPIVTDADIDGDLVQPGVLSFVSEWSTHTRAPRNSKPGLPTIGESEESETSSTLGICSQEDDNVDNTIAVDMASLHHHPTKLRIGLEQLQDVAQP
mmetsp:Transcript_19641/g.59516  ORF Transcript_19641/g.59516 Transcript_19641/m.59516 type:complete len:684 (-) Transcript_19641:224-2275(-)|eukprot:scaffold287496_cov30-Tisochrysis_lutea.AAC.2